MWHTGIAAVADAAQQRAGFHGVTNTSASTSALQLPVPHLDRTAATQNVVARTVSAVDVGHLLIGQSIGHRNDMADTGRQHGTAKDSVRRGVALLESCGTALQRIRTHEMHAMALTGKGVIAVIAQRDQMCTEEFDAAAVDDQQRVLAQREGEGGMIRRRTPFRECVQRRASGLQYQDASQAHSRTRASAMWPQRPPDHSPAGLRGSRDQQGGTSDWCVPRQHHSQPRESTQRNGGATNTTVSAQAARLAC